MATSAGTAPPLPFKVRPLIEVNGVAGWRCIAGPFTIPHEVEGVKAVLRDLEGQPDVGVFNISAMNTVVEVWRKIPTAAVAVRRP